ncbi:ATP-binding protein (plasmid) [Curtobacterium sp. TC1]|uniref:ATP-binding protein n=1 Tax=Curtobacterium sp. TC1 TaxID=2862880 RepID=UPI001C9B4765|nr:ATP-binding protein [Curtobacterium sp. TC1]QZQ53589.1 ATP-binding protein [Curtobacterium sp. TC1]
MDPLLNPFRPGAGIRPPELVGRQAEIDLVDLMVAHSRRQRNDGGLILYGLRGVGKTVLLSRLRQIVENAGWVTVQLEARPGESGKLIARQSLARGVAMAGRKMNRFQHALGEVREALASVTSFSATIGGTGVSLGVDPSPHRANSGLIEVDLEELVADLAAPLQKNQSAFAIFVDEMQDLDRDLLTALLAVQHRAGQQDWPFYIIGAGLSTLRRTLAEARSYSERFTIREVGPLAADAAATALAKPAEEFGARFTDEALAEILGAANGYPFFLQTYGKAVWELSTDRLIDGTTAIAGIEEGNADLDQGFFPARWDRTTPLERQYLRAIVAVSGSTASTSAIADALGKPATSLSPVRQSLIEKGIIFAERRGYVSFTVPNMDAFIRRQNDLDDVEDD